MSTTTQVAPPTKITTGVVRFSYLHIWEPTAVKEGDDKKYSLSIIIPKDDKETLAKINKAVEAAKKEGEANKYGGKKPKKFPLRDGDEERPEDAAYANSYFINANSKQKPGVVDKSLQPILNPDEVYSGCYGRVSINFYPFNFNGSIGVACGLNHVQKIKDGDPLGNTSRAEDDFADGFEEDDLL